MRLTRRPGPRHAADRNPAGWCLWNTGISLLGRRPPTCPRTRRPRNWNTASARPTSPPPTRPAWRRGRRWPTTRWAGARRWPPTRTRGPGTTGAWTSCAGRGGAAGDPSRGSTCPTGDSCARCMRWAGQPPPSASRTRLTAAAAFSRTRAPAAAELNGARPPRPGPGYPRAPRAGPGPAGRGSGTRAGSGTRGSGKRPGSGRGVGRVGTRRAQQAPGPGPQAQRREGAGHMPPSCWWGRSGVTRAKARRPTCSATVWISWSGTRGVTTPGTR